MVETGSNATSVVAMLTQFDKSANENSGHVWTTCTPSVRSISPAQQQNCYGCLDGGSHLIVGNGSRGSFELIRRHVARIDCQFAKLQDWNVVASVGIIFADDRLVRIIAQYQGRNGRAAFEMLYEVISDADVTAA